jgi:hypothetical protein
MRFFILGYLVSFAAVSVALAAGALFDLGPTPNLVVASVASIAIWEWCARITQTERREQ